MKKILYINQYFRHPKEPGITRSYWIAQKLIESGYSVTMLCHRNSLAEFVNHPPRVERITVDGIDVIYLRNKYANEMGIFSRTYSFLSFMLRAIMWTVREKNVDLVIATSTPLTVAVPALVRKWLRNTPFIFEVRDLWPDVPIQMKAIRNMIVIRLLRWLERTTYRHSAHVVALSPGMLEGVVKHIPQERTSMIPNMAKIDMFWPRPINQELRNKLGLQATSFKVIYFGQMGLSNALDYIIDAASLLWTNKKNVEFVFYGHGRFKQRLEQRMREEKIGNIFVYDRVPMRQMSEIVNLCDVSLVTFANIPILYTNSPNKLFDSLSAGKPVIVNSPGWTKAMVESNACGLFAEPDNSRDLAYKILQLKDNPQLLFQMGVNARRLAVTVYDKSILCGQFTKMVDSVWKKNIGG
jgi:glycosyltransferase involved in cell wall biosynthesis